MQLTRKGLSQKDSSKEPSSVAKITVWYTLGNVFVKGLAFLTTPIFTRMLSKADYGSFSNFTSWQTLLVAIVTLDFTASIAPAKYDYEGEMDAYLSSICVVSCVSTLLAYAVVCLGERFFEGLFSMDRTYIALMFLYILTYPAFSYLQAKHRIYQEYRLFVALSIASALVSTVLSVALVEALSDKLMGRTLGFVLPAAALDIVLDIWIIAKGRTIRWGMVRYALMISVPLVPHAVSGILLGSSDRIMITKYVGSESNALYTLAYQVSLMANMLWTSMNQAWAPWLYDNIHDGKRDRVREKSKIYLGVFSILILGTLLIAPELMLVLGGKQYMEARFVIPPVILGCVFQFVYGMYVNLEIYKKKTSLISLGTVLAALLNIGLNRVFIPRFGYIAAAYTTLAGYVALLLFHLLIVKRNLPELYECYDRSFIGVVLILLTVFGGISLILYRTQALRYMVLIVLLLIVVTVSLRHREQLLSLLGRESDK